MAAKKKDLSNDRLHESVDRHMLLLKAQGIELKTPDEVFNVPQNLGPAVNVLAESLKKLLLTVQCREDENLWRALDEIDTYLTATARFAPALATAEASAIQRRTRNANLAKEKAFPLQKPIRGLTEFGQRKLEEIHELRDSFHVLIRWNEWVKHASDVRRRLASAGVPAEEAFDVFWTTDNEDTRKKEIRLLEKLQPPTRGIDG